MQQVYYKEEDFRFQASEWGKENYFFENDRYFEKSRSYKEKTRRHAKYAIYGRSPPYDS